MIIKKKFLLIFVIISFSAKCQWGAAYSEGWGNREMKLYPNFFSSIDYVGDSINGHRLDIYFPKEINTNLNNLAIYGLNKEYDKIDKVVTEFKNQAKKYPCVIVIYGSAWRSNSGKDGALNHIKNGVKKLLKNDFIVVTVNHRSSDSNVFPAQVHDIKAAIRFLKGNSDSLRIDSNFIVVQGYSSGGHLAAFMGTTSGLKDFSYGGKKIDLDGSLGNYLDQNSDVHSVIDWYGPIDLLTLDDCPNIERTTRVKNKKNSSVFIGGPPSKNKIQYELANPITYINSKTPPFLIFHGAKDTSVLVCQSQVLHYELIKKGVPSKLIIEREGVHSGTNKKMFTQKNLDIMTDFIFDNYEKYKLSNK